MMMKKQKLSNGLYLTYINSLLYSRVCIINSYVDFITILGLKKGVSMLNFVVYLFLFLHLNKGLIS